MLMRKSVIKDRLSKSELKQLVKFLSYHLNFIPYSLPSIKIAKTARQFAQAWFDYKTMTPQYIEEVNSSYDAFYDHTTRQIVFQGFAYVDKTEIPDIYVIPMSTVIHELIHFFQFESGGYGSYQFLYEGTNELFSAFLTGDFAIDYPNETIHAFSLAMEVNDHDFFSAINWIRRFTVHSDKNQFVKRALRNSSLFSKYQPTNFLKKVDEDITQLKNEEVIACLRRYRLSRIRELLNRNRPLIYY